MLEEPRRHTRLSSPANNCTSSTTRSLHNFTFSPILSWGKQRVYRCITPNRNDNNKGESNSNPSESDQKPNESRPWNLRTRRANPDSNLKSSFSPTSSPPTLNTLSMEKGKRVCVDEVGYCNYKKFEGERCKFSIALKKEEIEEDFLRIKGFKPPRRSKKRSRYIQKQIDSVFPGCWLSEITPDLYKVDVERP